MARRSSPAGRLTTRLALLGLALGGGCAEPAPPANVVLITLDTTRADRLGAYGHGRDTSPNLDLLAAEAILFEEAYSTSSWTLPAHASLFTGKFPRTHGARYDPEGPLVITSAIRGPEYWDRYRARGMAPDETTLAGLLAARGFESAGFVAGPWLKRVFGLDLGFAHWDDDGIDETNGRPAAELTRAAQDWLAARGDPRRPFLLFLNYYDPHFPLEPPPGFREAFAPPGGRVDALPDGERLLALYDAEIRAMDHWLGRLFQTLKERGEWDDSWIVVTSDHGELLGENGRIGHGRTLSRAELHVPLIVKPPLGARVAAPRRVAEPVQLTDVLPFLLEELDLPVPPQVQGEPLLRARHPIVAEVHPLEIMSPDGDWEAIVAGGRKLSRSSLGVRELFDLARDPDEAHDLSEAEAALAAELEQRLERFLGSLPPPGEAGPERLVDDATSRALENLGYTGEPR